MIRANMFALTAVVCALWWEPLAYAYAAPALLVVSWTLVAIWIWENGTTDRVSSGKTESGEE